MAKRKYTIRSKNEIFRILTVLENNDMNKAKTALEVGVSRTTMFAYVQKYWDEYLNSKAPTKEEKQKITIERMMIAHDLSAMRNRVAQSFIAAMDEMDYRIADPELKKKVTNNQLIAHINNLIPYLVEKQAIMGVKDVEKDDPLNNYTTFVQTFVNQMNVKPKNPNNSSLVLRNN